MSKTIQMPKPRTEAQRTAARANGAKSNGPTTAEGKARSAQNAVRHGLLANCLVLSTESPELFLELLNDYLDQFQPQSRTENDLVEELAAARWQQQRCWIMTTHLMDVTMDRQADEVAAEFNKIDTATRMTLAFPQTSHPARRPHPPQPLRRKAHTRDYHRVLDKLEAIREKRQDQEKLNPPNEPEPMRTPEPSTNSAPQLATRHSSLATERGEFPAAPPERGWDHAAKPDTSVRIPNTLDTHSSG